MKWTEKLCKRWDQICLYYLYLPSILLGIAIFHPHHTVKIVFGALTVGIALFDLFRYLYKERKKKMSGKN